MISESDEYKFVSEQFRWHSDKIVAIFNTFISLFSAILGGSIYLSVQSRDVLRGYSYQILSDLIVVLSAVVACILIEEYARSRLGYRRRISVLSGRDEKGDFRIPMPKGIGNLVIECAMITSILGVSAAFWLFNPFALFRISAHSN